MVIRVEYKSMKKEKEKSFLFKSYILYEFHIFDNEDLISKSPSSMFIRYSKAYSFNSFLKNKFNFEILPFFPKKLFFHTNSKLEERAKNLENYFNKLLSSNNEEIKNEIANFIYSNLKKDNNVTLSRKSTMDTLDIFEEIDYKTDDLNIVENLLKDLDSNDLMISELIDNFTFQNRNKILEDNILSSEQIYLLFYGEKKLKGVINYIGDCVEKNIIGSISCLKLIHQLINPENNFNYLSYRAILRLITKYKLRDFHFEKLLALNNPQISECIYQIIKCICETDTFKFQDFFISSDCNLYYDFYNLWLKTNF